MYLLSPEVVVITQNILFSQRIGQHSKNYGHMLKEQGN